MRLYSWNVNGLRAAAKKGWLDWFHDAKGDVVCLQETKAHVDQLPPETRLIDGYHVSFSSGIKKGYSGVATYTRPRANSIAYGFGLDPSYDNEGRILVHEYDKFTLLNIYFPNGTSGEPRLLYKMGFYKATLEYCNALRAQGRPLVICGDVNTAHYPIDLARPKENEGNSGFLPIERAWMDQFVAAGYVDTFRALHPNRSDAFSWWTFRSGARERNIGWRIDYFFVSDDLMPRVQGAEIFPHVEGSDHCPVSLDLDI